MFLKNDETSWYIFSPSQGRQSKPQPDLDAGVCLRTSEFRAFTLPDYLTRSLPTQYYFPVPRRDITANPGRLGKKLCQPVLCSFSVTCQELLAKALQHLPEFVSMSSLTCQGLSHFQELSSSQTCTFSPGPLLLWKHQSKEFMCRSTACDQSPEWWFSHVSQLEDSGCVISLVQLLTKFTTSL